MGKISYKVYQGNIVPEKDTIFVFGSNPEGRHGAGSAKVARKYFGAIYGQGEGLQGNSYALPTTELRPDYQYNCGSVYTMSPQMITENIMRMYECARENPDKKFKVAYRNMADERTLCGYSGSELMKLFRRACDGNYPDNIYFSQEWADSGYLD